MKYLNNEEKKIIESVENGEWKTIKNFAEIKQSLKTAAKNTMLKDQRMNIRIAKRDLEALKVLALEQGMPYQTLVSSILHKYITGQLKDKKA